MLPRVPLIVILGATGSGKTKLSLGIACKYGGEIISADSMQVYKGLDIITAKATPEEQSQAPHHLLDVIDPIKNFSVVDFRNKALKIINDLFERNKMPVIVGGTNYYIESILWDVLVDKVQQETLSDNVSASDSEGNPAKKLRIDETKSTSLKHLLDTIQNIASEHEQQSVVSSDLKTLCAAVKSDKFNFINDDLTISSLELHDVLKRVDPKMADRLHPNNRRKIIRALQVIIQEGRLLSDILEEQQSMDGGCTVGGPLRYPNTLIFWVKAEQKILDERLNKRVDKMIEDGLLKELTDFHQRYNEERIKINQQPDYTKGIFQSIGFKEFHDYLMLNEDDQKSSNGQKLLAKGIEDLKLVTRRYARKQNRWIQNRFLGNPKRQVPPLYALDSSDVSKWHENVEMPAFNIIDCYMSQTECIRHKPLPVNTIEKGEPLSKCKTYVCETCKRTFVGDLQWNVHLKSGKHHRMLKKLNKQQQTLQNVQTIQQNVDQEKQDQ